MTLIYMATIFTDQLLHYLMKHWPVLCHLHISSTSERLFISHTPTPLNILLSHLHLLTCAIGEATQCDACGCMCVCGCERPLISHIFSCEEIFQIQIYKWMDWVEKNKQNNIWDCENCYLIGENAAWCQPWPWLSAPLYCINCKMDWSYTYTAVYTKSLSLNEE